MWLPTLTSLDEIRVGRDGSDTCLTQRSSDEVGVGVPDAIYIPEEERRWSSPKNQRSLGQTDFSSKRLCEDQKSTLAPSLCCHDSELITFASPTTGCHSRGASLELITHAWFWSSRRALLLGCSNPYYDMCANATSWMILTALLQSAGETRKEEGSLGQ